MNNTAIIISHDGMGDAPRELRHTLIGKFLSLTIESGDLPAKIVFYTEGVKLVCQGSPVIDQLKEIEKRGTELVICQTCLNYFNLADTVAVGVVGGMGDILTVIQQAEKVITL